MSEENLVPDDDLIPSEKPDAVVILEEKKTEDKPESTVVETVVRPAHKGAAEEGVEALARNLEESKKKLEKATADKISAEDRATQAEARAATSESKISSQQQQNIEANRTAATNAIDAAKSRMERAEAEYEQFQAEGKFKEALQASKVAAKAEWEIEGAQKYLKDLDVAVEKLKSSPPERQAPKDTENVDPVTGIKFTPKTFDYVKAQGENWKDQDFRVACDAASRMAKRKGIAADTDEWFSFVDNHLVAMGYKDAPETTEDEVVIEPTPKPVVAAKKPSGASVSPSPSRAVAGTNGVPKKGIKLSGAERDVAQSIVDSLPELFKGENPDLLYAKNKQDGLNEHGEDWLRTPTN